MAVTTHNGTEPSSRLGFNLNLPWIFWECFWESEAASRSRRAQVPAATPNPACGHTPTGEASLWISLGVFLDPAGRVIRGPASLLFQAHGARVARPPQLHPSLPAPGMGEGVCSSASELKPPWTVYLSLTERETPQNPSSFSSVLPLTRFSQTLLQLP